VVIRVGGENWEVLKPCIEIVKGSVWTGRGIHVFKLNHVSIAIH
jgi:hypothetical protein